jgi:hypothetical protein
MILHDMVFLKNRGHDATVETDKDQIRFVIYGLVEVLTNNLRLVISIYER